MKRISRLLKNSLRAVQGCAAIFRARFMCSKNGAKQKSHFLLCGLKKAIDGLFQQPAVSALLCAVVLLAACGADEARLSVQEWQGVTIGVETRPAPVVMGMNEFLISARGARGAVYDLLVFIRMGDDKPWTQAIQDGRTGVYRRALEVQGAGLTLQVQVKRAGQETVLSFALPAMDAR